MKNTLFLFIMIIIFACNPRTKSPTIKIRDENLIKPKPFRSLVGTKWSYQITEGCINTYYFFEDTKYSFYSCEIEDTFYGDYKIENDTLILHEYITSGDSLLAENSPHRSEPAIYKLILFDGRLKLVSRYEYLNDRWKKSDFVFPESNLYSKSDSTL
jgi:hypothetical protein